MKSLFSSDYAVSVGQTGLGKFIIGSWIYLVFYNFLVLFIAILPGGSVGGAVILLTIFVKLLLAPLTYRALIQQIKQKKIEPVIADIRKRLADKREQQAQEIMKVYKENKVNPFTGCFIALIQIVIIFPLYYLFIQFSIVPDQIFSFIPVPETINLQFLGFSVLQTKSIFWALLAGVSQFVQFQLSPAMQMAKPKPEEAKDNPQLAMASSLQATTKYILPIIIGFTAFIVPIAVSLYWIVSNVFTIIQELVIRKKIAKDENRQAVINSSV